MRRPLIVNDRRFLDALRGVRFALLLARGEMLAVCDRAQRTLRTGLAGLDVVYPRAHLTLANFARGTDPDQIRAALARWSAATAPLSLRTQGIAFFGPPQQVVYVPIWRNAALGRAYARLRQDTLARGLNPVGGDAASIALERWLPHLSLAYCDRLDAAGWERAVAAARGLKIAPVECLVPAVDLIAYEHDGEHLLMSLPLRVGRRS